MWVGKLFEFYKEVKDDSARSLFWGLMAIAGDGTNPGLVCFDENIGYTLEQISSKLNMSDTTLKESIKILEKAKVIKTQKNNVIKIVHWEHYQSEYERQKPHRNPVYKGIREKIFERDNFTCQECYKKEEKLKVPLCMHHIDSDKENNNAENLITLCISCHSQLLKKGLHPTKGNEIKAQEDRFNQKVQSKGSRVEEEVRSKKKEERSKTEINTIMEKWNLFVNHINEKMDIKLSVVLKMTSLRESHIAARLKEKEFDIDNILKHTENSDFLLGLVLSKDRKPFKVYFDWILNPNNYVKIIEGNYDNKQKKPMEF